MTRSKPTHIQKERPHQMRMGDIMDICSGKAARESRGEVPIRIDDVLMVVVPKTMPSWRWRRDRSRPRWLKTLPKARKAFNIPPDKILTFKQFMRLMEKYKRLMEKKGTPC